MKNILFEAFINDLVMLGEAGKKPVNPTAKKPAAKKKLRAGESEEFPGYFWKGGIYYSNVSKTGQVTHKKDKGRMVALTNQEKAEYRAKRAGKSPAKPAPQAQPATQGYGKDFIGGQGRGITPSSTPVKPKVDTKQTIGDLEARASAPARSSLGERKKQISRELADAMKSGDTKRIQGVITKYGIKMGKSGRLTFSGSDKPGLADEQLSFKVFVALKNMGVTITDRQGKEVDANQLLAALSPGGTKKKNPFKPQNTFGEVDDVLDVEDITRDAEGNVTGCTVEGVRLDKITTDEENRLIQARIETARQRFGGELTDEEMKEFEQNIEEYIRARVREQNANIDFLVEVQEKGKARYLQFPKKGETTEAATARMVTKLGELVDTHITDPTRRETARTALNDMAEQATKMRTAKTREERRDAVKAYNAALAAFQEAAEGSDLGKSISDVGESLVALRSVALGKTVLIPDSQSFPLADVVTIGRNPVTGEMSIELFIVHVDAQESISVADSVKAGAKGNAGVTHEKDAHSEFGPVTRADGSTIEGDEVKQDLIKMGGVDRKNAIFTTDGKLAPAEKERIIGELEKYGDEVRAYFGLPTDPNAEGYLNAEQLYEFLSYGKKIACVDGRPAPSSDGTRTADTDEDTNSENYEQWQAWSVVGLMHEAVHNRTVTQQFYKTSQIKRNGLVIADGARTLARAESQFSKGTTRPEGRRGKVPNSSMVAFSIPAEEKDLRNGNPCKE